MLIVSGRGDWSAKRVAKQLEAWGCAYSWLDPADFPRRVQVTARLGRGWRGEVQTPDGVFFWEDISAVFYRRPRDFDMPSAMSGPEQRFARAQARIGLGGVLASLPVKWINHPSALADCEYKPRQLNLAQTVGLRVPATIVTNAPDEVRRFAAEQGDIIVKSLAEPIIAEAGSQKSIWTRRVAAPELVDLTGLELTTHLFQEWIPKAYEIRLTVVGKRDFAVAIHAHSAAARIDWRTDYDALTYEVMDCPAEVAERARVFLSAAGLTYGAFDFIVTADTEDYVFLECNAAGQWGWLAEECGLPIAEAIADELIGDDR
ncbi:MAG TPA: ATP-grasp ribosomal peptide maturase [Pseudonocardiaceae bacterium]|nr:ATP-grasp ribosomal peptide maturase [Pseudonocardiaceae bacterium]